MDLNVLYYCAFQYYSALHALSRENKTFDDVRNPFEDAAEKTLYHSITNIMFRTLGEYCGEYRPNYNTFKDLFAGVVLNKNTTVIGEIDKKEYTILTHRDIIDFFAAQKKSYDILFPEEN